MGSVRAGDIRQLKWFGRELDIKGEDANVTLDLGGYLNEATINGNGSFHNTRRRKKALVGDVPVSIDDARGDLEFLQEKADAGEPGALSITLASGVSYTGNMMITGELRKSTGDGTATLTFEGAKLTKL